MNTTPPPVDVGVKTIPPGDPAAGRSPGLWKTLLFSATALLTLALFVEAATRVGFFLGDNFSAYYLTFGFVPDIEHHSAKHKGYTKFQPNSVYRYKTARGTTLLMHINGDGFRSQRQFVRPKPPGTLRVIALGESSTFGLSNDDDHTYPALLEAYLRRRAPDRPVEVFNLGIPHNRSNNILALAREELAALEPDVVTLYAGFNNAMVLPSAQRPGLVYRLKDWFKAHSVTYRALHPYVTTAYYKLSKMFKADPIGIPHLGLPVTMPAERVARRRAEAAEEFGVHLDSLIRIVNAAGARFVLVTQGFSFTRLPTVRIAAEMGSYAAEVAYVDSLLNANGEIPAPYATLLVHHDIMERVREAARRYDLPLLDGIAVLDGHRATAMVSFVHLTDDGNRRLAAALDSTLACSGLLPLEWSGGSGCRPKEPPE